MDLFRSMLVSIKGGVFRKTGHVENEKGIKFHCVFKHASAFLLAIIAVSNSKLLCFKSSVIHFSLTPCILVTSAHADSLCKQFGPRSGPT